MDNKETNVVDHPEKKTIPTDYAISIHIQNLFATYGEERVRSTLSELFGLKSKNKKAA